MVYLKKSKPGAKVGGMMFLGKEAGVHVREDFVSFGKEFGFYRGC